MALFAILLIIVGAFHIFAPEAAWYLHIGWKLRDAEPSEGYLTFLRISGGLGCVIGIIMIIVALVHS